MENIIAMTRALGRAIQQDESFIRLSLASQANDEDEHLQGLINEFNLKSLAINNEAAKPERDTQKLAQLNKELRAAYQEVMGNEKMAAYNQAKQDFDSLMNRVTAIISASAEGDNPDTADYTPGCGGGCSSCAGCG